MGGRKWGQHFFWNRGLAEKIVDLIPITPEDYVLEIGPGKGILTRFILNRTPHLTALEIDPELAELRRTTFEGVGDPHHYEARRALVDMVPESALRQTPDAVVQAHAADWRSLFVAGRV